jgi:peroxiredoxin
MLSDFIRAYPNMPVIDERLKRMLGAYSLNKGSKAPVLVVLEKPLSQPAILIFFDSNCDHCHHELDSLNVHYAELTKKGYRIISIAVDTDPNNYRQAAAGFAWDRADRLCDFKGFAGENFKNYGIVGVPTIFVVDKNGFITGRYAQVLEFIKTI